MDAATEARLRDMIDRRDIWQALMRWARGVDRFDRDLTLSAYFDDAIEDHGQYIGDADGFFAWVTRTMAGFVSTQHALSTHYCEIEGDDAHCETCFSFTGVAPQPPHLFSVGRYIDHFQRRDGEWRIANRVTIIEGRFDLLDWQYAHLAPPDYRPDELRPASRDKADASYQRPVRPRQPRAPST